MSISFKGATYPVIDAKMVPVLSRDFVISVRHAGVVCASVVCAIWEEPQKAWRALEHFKEFVKENSDLVYCITSVDDLETCFYRSSLGIVLSWQDSRGFGGDPAAVERVAEAGVRIVQPAFLEGNEMAAGYLDARDTGLTALGRELVSELNQSGVAIDLSHVSRKTVSDVLETSAQPPFIAMTAPQGMNPATRNISDGLARDIVDAGGVVCVSALKDYLPDQGANGVDDLARAIVYLAELLGHGAVGIGSDLTIGQPPEFFRSLVPSTSTAPQDKNYRVSGYVDGFEDVSGYAALERSLRHHGLAENEIHAILSSNVAGYFGSVWSERMRPRPG